MSGFEPKWKLKERVVALLEKAISPDARVETDVRLPRLVGRGKRQCDVVVRYGRPPRETLAIVEVQDRTRKVDETTFDGWCAKMRSVGAQHLFCVSARGYPSSVREKAQRIGPTVRLLTLAQLEDGQGPQGTLLRGFHLKAFRKKHTDSEISIIRILLPSPIQDEIRFKLAISFTLNEKVWQREDGGRPQSLNDLVDQKLNLVNLDALGPGEHWVDVLSPADGAFRHLTSTPPAWVHVTAKCIIEVEEVDVPLSCLTYSQEDYGGQLGWVMTATGEVFGQAADFRIIMVQEPGGDYRISGPFTFGVGITPIQPLIFSIDGQEFGGPF